MRSPATTGALRRRLTLEAPLETPDDSGGFTRSWQPVGEVWAQIEPIREFTRFEAQQGEMILTHRVTMRWRNDLTGAMRLRWGSRKLEILTVADADAHRRCIICRCREITS